jgi:hypothetical protein
MSWPDEDPGWDDPYDWEPDYDDEDEEEDEPVSDPLYDAMERLDRGEIEEEDVGRLAFANPGSALRAASKHNPRNLPCPTCGRKNMLTPADRARHYQCDYCADQAEGLGW